MSCPVLGTEENVPAHKCQGHQSKGSWQCSFSHHYPVFLSTALPCQGNDGRMRRLGPFHTQASPGLASPLRNTLSANLGTAWGVGVGGAAESSILRLLCSHSSLYALLIPIPVLCDNTSGESIVLLRYWHQDTNHQLTCSSTLPHRAFHFSLCCCSWQS